MAGKSFGAELAEAARQAQSVVRGRTSYWYVEVDGKVRIAECIDASGYRYCFLPGQALSKTYYLGNDPEYVKGRPEIKFLRQIPSLEDLEDLDDAAVERDLAD